MSPWIQDKDGKQQFRPTKHHYEPPHITESFQWMQGLDTFKTLDAGPNTIKIKGRALTSGTVSLNNRKYVDSEILRAARTLIGKGVSINHDSTKMVGNVDWAEYENGALEYIATIKKQPYVDLLRNKSTDIKGVSVEAAYLYNECARCNRKFETEEAYRHHMLDEEFIKDFNSVPHGINFQALSLVLAPETPGVSDTTIELAETAPGLERLFEMIIGKGEKLDGKIEEKDSHGGLKTHLTDTGQPGNVLLPGQLRDYPALLNDGKDPFITIDQILARNRGATTAEIENLAERVEKRGNQFCVVHCHGPEGGTVIKCFDSEADAMAMHNAMQANTAEIVQRELKITMENLPKTVSELCALGDRYNETGLAINEWKKGVDVKVAETLKIITEGSAEIAMLKQSLPETRKVLALTETQQILLENARDKIKGQFKGKSKAIVMNQSTTYEDPMKTMVRTLPYTHREP
jgi:hypothetical protein